MCPCVVATPVFWYVIGFVLLIVAGIGYAIWKAAPVVGIGLAGVSIALWRWVSGATLAKPVGTRESTLPARRLARHVHATGRVVIPTLAILGYLYPLLGVMVLAITGGASLGGGLLVLRKRRDAHLKAVGAPIKVRAEIGRG